jgi:hypothetical protein
MKVQNRNPVKNEVMEEKGRKSAEKVFNTTLLVDGRLLESEPSSPVSLSPLPLLATAATTTTMGQFFWSSQPTHSHLIFSEGTIA